MASITGSASQRQKPKWLRSMLRDKLATAGFIVVLVMVLAAILAPFVAPYGPRDQSILDRLQGPSASYLLGTDVYGRDLLSRVIWGARISLLVGIGSVTSALVVGSTLGIIGGYLGGRIDTFINWLTDVLMSFPSLILGFMVVALIGNGLENLIIAIAIGITPRFIRVARAATLALKNNEYVTSATALGARTPRVLGKHVLPNVTSEITVVSTLWMATAIRTEASLAFIGLGVPPPTPTLGGMIRDGLEYINTSPWPVLVPGIAVLLIVLGFNLIGDGVQDAIDPRNRS